MIKDVYLKRPFLLFLPFLLLYVFITVSKYKGFIEGDEQRYYQFAENIIHGFYSPPAPDINLWNGPGYPLIMTPFAWLKLPYICIILLNPIFQYLSVVLLFKSLIQICSKNISVAASIFWGLYFNIYTNLYLAYTECFACLLIAGFTFFIVSYYFNKKLSYLIGSGMALGYLALTKIIFGYVILIGLVIMLVYYVIKKYKSDFKSATWVLLIAVATTSPYLIYTYHLTGKLFYWGNSGGMSLYWMSSPFTNEYGDWRAENLININFPEPYARGTGDSLLKANHGEDIKTVLKYTGVKKEEVYKQMALRNIKAHPAQYLKNCLSNISRMLFNSPYSYTYQTRPIFYNVLLSSIIVVLSLFTLIMTLLNWRKVIFPVKFLMLIILLYLGLSTLASTYGRMFDIIVPVFLLWIAFVLDRTVKLKRID